MNKKRYFLILIIVILITIAYLINLYSISLHKKMYEKVCYDCDNDCIEIIYNEKSELFSFDKNNNSIITIEELLSSNASCSFDTTHDKYGNDCIGYYVIHKNDNNKIKIDSSHICDMIDY